MSEPQDVRTRLHDQLASVTERIALARDVNAQIVAERAVAYSPDESVRVEVDASGRLLDIAFGTGISAVDPERLGRIVLETYASAQRRSADRVGEIVDEAWGAESETARAMRQQATDHLITLPDESDSGPQSPARSTHWSRS